MARIIANETAKGVRIAWTYRATQVAAVLSMASMARLAPGDQYFVGGGRIVDALEAETAPGLFAYVVVNVASMRLVAEILEVRNAGTLGADPPQPTAAWQLAIGRLAGSRSRRWSSPRWSSPA